MGSRVWFETGVGFGVVQKHFVLDFGPAMLLGFELVEHAHRQHHREGVA